MVLKTWNSFFKRRNNNNTRGISIATDSHRRKRKEKSKNKNKDHKKRGQIKEPSVEYMKPHRKIHSLSQQKLIKLYVKSAKDVLLLKFSMK